jgi:hypothetical protein
MIRGLLVAGLMLFFANPSSFAGEIYTWKDQQGTVHFSDEPHTGASQVNLQSPQSYQPPASTAGSANTTASSTSATPASAEQVGYTTLKIDRPQPEETIWDNNGQVVVAVTLVPDLRSEDKLQLLLDGQPIGELQTTTTMNVSGIPRGTHQLQVQVMGGNGKVVATSDGIVFYMHHAIQKKG